MTRRDEPEEDAVAPRTGPSVDPRLVSFTLRRWWKREIEGVAATLEPGERVLDLVYGVVGSPWRRGAARTDALRLLVATDRRLHVVPKGARSELVRSVDYDQVLACEDYNTGFVKRQILGWIPEAGAFGSRMVPGLRIRLADGTAIVVEHVEPRRRTRRFAASVRQRARG